MNAREETLTWSEVGRASRPIGGGTRYTISIRPETVPIVFVPGIMGTRLRTAADGNRVWDPDRPAFMLYRYGAFWVDPHEKQEALFGKARTYERGYAIPYDDDRKHNARIDARYPGSSARGWGEVSWKTYEPILGTLARARWSPLIDRCFDLPVYACGYDWRGPASASAERLTRRVREIIRAHGSSCRQAILVTHSLGGIVARTACKDHGLERDVLGVVHTVQPATGAPAAYWRMKAGFERGFRDDDLAEGWWSAFAAGVASYPVAWCLGATGAEVTALLAHMPGGLELLPTKAYRDNDGHAGWLRYRDEDGTERRLPERGDPYTEIYRNTRDEWRLVRWPEHIVGRGPGQVPATFSDAAWSDCCRRLNDVEEFHERLGGYQHPLTHHIYASERTTADRVSLQRAVLTVNHDPKRDRPVAIDDRGRFRHDMEVDGTGNPHARRVRRLAMAAPEGDGDGTVPTSSASFLASAAGARGRLVWGGRDYEQTGTDVGAAEHDGVFERPQAVRTVVRAVQALCAAKIEGAMGG